MTSSVFELAELEGFDASAFGATEPFPSWTFDGLLSEAAFAALCASFPPIEWFERHAGIARVHGQRPHDRLYLAYETSLYHPGDQPRLGVARHEALSPEWQRFIDALRGDASYQRLIAATVGSDDFVLRFAWHIGSRGDEVSPHVDAAEKLGTHIFYFNASGTWESDWGGQTCLLGGKSTSSMSPDVSDFDRVVAIDQRPNRSLLMRNGPDAWHGVEPLACPSSAQRRLFNVVIDRRTTPAEPKRGWLRSLTKRG